MNNQPGAGRFGSALPITTGLICLLCIVPVGAVQPAPSAGVDPCQESLPALYQRISPVVVLIQATSIDPYDAEHRIQRVMGSGVIIDSSGLILTNSHVVFGSAAIAVVLDDGTALPASPVGADPIFDLALIRIPTPKEGTLPSGQLGDSNSVRVGDEAYAIGNPLGLDQTITRDSIGRLRSTQFFPSAEPGPCTVRRATGAVPGAVATGCRRYGLIADGSARPAAPRKFVASLSVVNFVPRSRSRK